MTDFFDQICRVLAENGKKHPGQLAKSEDMRQFFSAVEKKVEPAAEVPPPPPPPSPAPVRQEVKPLPVKSQDWKDLPPAEALEALRRSFENCSKCPLASGRKHIVFGEGNPNARLMFIGEAPGYDEDISGRPFVGKAGMLLDKMITAMQFSREEIYIANIVKCRPAGNRNPMPEEIAQCIDFLKEQINIIRPEVIVALGAVAAKSLIACDGGISKLRGRWCSYENIPVMPTFHPAYLLRQESAKRDAWQDLQQVMARFGKFHGKR